MTSNEVNQDLRQAITKLLKHCSFVETVAKSLWDSISGLKFDIVEVAENFSPSATFSSIKLSTKRTSGVFLTSLLSFEKSWLFQ